MNPARTEISIGAPREAVVIASGDRLVGLQAPQHSVLPRAHPLIRTRARASRRVMAHDETVHELRHADRLAPIGERHESRRALDARFDQGPVEMRLMDKAARTRRRIFRGSLGKQALVDRKSRVIFNRAHDGERNTTVHATFVACSVFAST